MRQKTAFIMGISLLLILLGATSPSNAIITQSMTFKYSVKKGETYTWKVTSIDTGLKNYFASVPKIGDETTMKVIDDPNQLTGTYYAGPPDYYGVATSAYYFNVTTPDGTTMQYYDGADYVFPVSATLQDGTVLTCSDILVIVATSNDLFFFKQGNEFSYELQFSYNVVWTFNLDTGLLSKLTYTDENGKSMMVQLQTPSSSKGGFLGLPLPTAPIFVGFVAIAIVARKERKYLELKRK